MSDNIGRDIRLKQVYSQLDRKFEEQETEKQALQNKLPHINLQGHPVDPTVLGLLTKERAQELEMLIFYKEGRILKAGIVAPSEAIDQEVKRLTAESYYVELYQISKTSFEEMLKHYSKVKTVVRHSDEIDLKSAKETNFEIASIQDLSQILKGASATKLIETLVGSALSMESSDIHVEPEAQGVKIRYRIDGVLQDVAELEPQSHHTLSSRIKILSKLKLNVTTVPQDGSFHLKFDDKNVDIRVSVIPSAFGESFVMRLLRQDKQDLRFEEVGITGLAHERLLKEMQKPNGMILTTGPTGSGKTTTLYAIVNKLNEPGIKIITLEDPVEYRIQGITQTPIDASAGMTFASGLRAVLRQDPDIVMVGEMRDLETAETAAQAALTGHIVLSTLHTNDAPSAIPRLLDMGIKPFTLAPAINAIIAQRLVRRICTHCKVEYKPDKSLMARVEMLLSAVPANAGVKVPKQLKFMHSPGCKQCRGLGYKGRIGVYEVFTVNEAVEKLIHKEATTSEVRAQAVTDGMLTMAQDGVLKALAGITDIEEVFRVTEG